MFLIGLSGIKVHAPVGVYDWEKEQGRDFEVDVEIQLDFNPDEISDDINQTLNYEDVIVLVKEVMSSGSDLIETKIIELGNAILKEFNGVIELKIRLNKLNPMNNGEVDKSFVERIFIRN
ncbi:MAG: dihydroneopterin aldolase [Bacteroidetes bacterium]|nr:dihydroneopterin aldolase [Bacteroidota bacterium]